MAIPYEHKKWSIELTSEELLELKVIYEFAKDWF
jgi:hypothetical protein